MHAQAGPHILAIAGDAQRGMYRFTLPMRALIERGSAVGNVVVAPAQIPKVRRGSALLLQGSIALAPAIIATAKKSSCYLVQDVDDPLWTTMTSDAVDLQLRCADVITVSNEPLAEALRKRGYASNLLTTTIDPRDWSVQPPRAQRMRLRIGWQAPRDVHADEVALLTPIVQALVNKADFVFIGHVPQALGDLGGRVERHTDVPLSFFPSLLAALDLDIMLAPVAFNAVNECRSNLPLLQAGMLGYAVIATDIQPFRALPVTRLPNNHGAWIAAICERMNAGKALAAEGEALRRAVHADFLTESSAQRHLALWTGTS